MRGVHLRFKTNQIQSQESLYYMYFGEVQSGMGHVLVLIESASQHEVAPWFVTVVVWIPLFSVRIL